MKQSSILFLKVSKKQAPSAMKTKKQAPSAMKSNPMGLNMWKPQTIVFYNVKIHFAIC